MNAKHAKHDVAGASAAPGLPRPREKSGPAIRSAIARGVAKITELPAAPFQNGMGELPPAVRGAKSERLLAADVTRQNVVAVVGRSSSAHGRAEPERAARRARQAGDRGVDRSDP